MSDTVLN